MIETFFSINALGSPLALLNIFIMGFTLGWCFEQAGFGSSKKTIASFYFKDMSFLKTSFSALLTCSIGVAILFKLGLVTVDKLSFSDTFLWAQSIGGFLFGIGFIMSGWTFSTSIVGLAAGRIDALVFLIFAGLGVVIFNETFSLYKVLYELGGLGISSICEIFSSNWFSCIALMACIIIFLLWIMKLIDARFSLTKLGAGGKGLWVFSMIVFILISFLIVPVEKIKQIEGTALSSQQMSLENKPQQLVKAAELDDYLLAPKTFAQERVLGQKAIVLVDIRPKAAFEAWHINGSSNYPIEAIALSLERFKRFDRIVLLDDDMKDLNEVLNTLLEKNFKNIYILDGGIEKFKRDVLFEGTAPEDLSEDDRIDFELWRALFVGSAQASSAVDPLNLNSLIGGN